MASPTTRAHPRRGTVARRPQTTATHGDFLSSTSKYVMNVFDTTNIAFGTNIVTPVMKAVPGYIARLWITIKATGGVAGGTNAVAAADAPWNIIQTVQIRDASGYPVVNLDGFKARLATMYGGQAGPGPFTDPAVRPSYSAIAASGNFTCVFEFNFELGDAVGCVAGGGQDRVWSVQLNLNPAATVYSTVPGGTVPVLEFRGDVEFYGAPLADPTKVPRALGTSVQWSMANGIGQPSTGGSQNIMVPAPNLGGFLGCLIAEARDTNNARVDGVWTGSNDINLYVDQQPRSQELWSMSADRMARAFGVGLGSPFPTRPTGSLAWTFRDSLLPNGPIGLDNLRLWEPSNTGTLAELRSGAWGAFSNGPATVSFVTQRYYPVDHEIEGIEIP